MNKIKYWLIKHIVIPKLITDDQLTPKQTQIFRLYFDTESKDNFADWRRRKLVSYSLHRALVIHILVTMMGRGIQLRDKINLIDLKTVHGGYYKDYFIRHIESDWIREKWYRKNNLPIVARIKNENYVIDGNHRLGQQILRNDIKYNYIELTGGWFKLYLKYCIGF